MDENKQAARAIDDYLGAARVFIEAIDLATIKTEHFKDELDPSIAGVAEYRNTMLMMKLKNLNQILESIK